MRTIKTFLFLATLVTAAGTVSAQNIERMFQTDVKIYLQQTGVAPEGPSDLFLRPVERMVPVDFKLKYTFRALFEEELPEEEVEAGFTSPTYGMQFEGVSLRNGSVTVRFSQPPGKTNYGSLGPMVFVEAITKTARQFRSVKRVSICAVGKTTIDSELKRPFPRCPTTR